MSWKFWDFLAVVFHFKLSAMSNTEIQLEHKTSKRLTYEELIAFEGFENYTEQEANHIIETLFQFSILCFQLKKKGIIK